MLLLTRALTVEGTIDEIEAGRKGRVAAGSAAAFGRPIAIAADRQAKMSASRLPVCQMPLDKVNRVW